MDTDEEAMARCSWGRRPRPMPIGLPPKGLMDRSALVDRGIHHGNSGGKYSAASPNFPILRFRVRSRDALPQRSAFGPRISQRGSAATDAPSGLRRAGRDEGPCFAGARSERE